MQKGSVIKANESFTLRKVDPKNLGKGLLDGKFAERGLPVCKVKTVHTILKIGKEIGSDGNSEVYQYKTKIGNQQTVYTVGHDAFAEHNGEAPSHLTKCRFCLRGNMKNPMKIPIVMITETSKNKNGGMRGENVTFMGIHFVCDFGCALSYVKRKLGESRYCRNSLYMNAEQILYCYYYRQYPDRFGQRIREKPDPEYLRCHGGSLTDEEFDSGAAEFVPMQNVICLPIKTQFLRLNI